MLIHNIGQLVTTQGGPQRGSRLGELHIVPQAAVLIRNGKIAALGAEADLLAAYPDEPRFDAQGRAVVPGLVDPHTHLLWAGERAAEFEMRLQGKTYLEILQAGGGILSTVQATRRASVEALMAETRPRLLRAFAHGATTLEVKTGYGLTMASEFKMLEAILALDDEGPWELVPTFLAAHAVPPEFRNRADAYADLICREMLPALKGWWQEHGGGRPLPFVDVFCETGAFDLEQTRCILETAKANGLPVRNDIVPLLPTR
jgi:imidazolonepropionase